MGSGCSLACGAAWHSHCGKCWVLVPQDAPAAVPFLAEVTGQGTEPAVCAGLPVLAPQVGAREAAGGLWGPWEPPVPGSWLDPSHCKGALRPLLGSSAN